MTLVAFRAVNYVDEHSRSLALQNRALTISSKRPSASLAESSGVKTYYRQCDALIKTTQEKPLDACTLFSLGSGKTTTTDGFLFGGGVLACAKATHGDAQKPAPPASTCSFDEAGEPLLTIDEAVPLLRWDDSPAMAADDLREGIYAAKCVDDTYHGRSSGPSGSSEIALALEGVDMSKEYTIQSLKDEASTADKTIYGDESLPEGEYVDAGWIELPEPVFPSFTTPDMPAATHHDHDQLLGGPTHMLQLVSAMYQSVSRDIALGEGPAECTVDDLNLKDLCAKAVGVGKTVVDVLLHEQLRCGASSSEDVSRSDDLSTAAEEWGALFDAEDDISAFEMPCEEKVAATSFLCETVFTATEELNELWAPRDIGIAAMGFDDVFRQQMAVASCVGPEERKHRGENEKELNFMSAFRPRFLESLTDLASVAFLVSERRRLDFDLPVPDSLKPMPSRFADPIERMKKGERGSLREKALPLWSFADIKDYVYTSLLKTHSSILKVPSLSRPLHLEFLRLTAPQTPTSAAAADPPADVLDEAIPSVDGCVWDESIEVARPPCAFSVFQPQAPNQPSRKRKSEEPPPDVTEASAEAAPPPIQLLPETHMQVQAQENPSTSTLPPNELATDVAPVRIHNAPSRAGGLDEFMELRGRKSVSAVQRQDGDEESPHSVAERIARGLRRGQVHWCSDGDDFWALEGLVDSSIKQLWRHTMEATQEEYLGLPPPDLSGVDSLLSKCEKAIRELHEVCVGDGGSASEETKKQLVLCSEVYRTLTALWTLVAIHDKLTDAGVSEAVAFASVVYLDGAYHEILSANVLVMDALRALFSYRELSFPPKPVTEPEHLSERNDRDNALVCSGLPYVPSPTEAYLAKTDSPKLQGVAKLCEKYPRVLVVFSSEKVMDVVVSVMKRRFDSKMDVMRPTLPTPRRIAMLTTSSKIAIHEACFFKTLPAASGSRAALEPAFEIPPSFVVVSYQSLNIISHGDLLTDAIHIFLSVPPPTETQQQHDEPKQTADGKAAQPPRTTIFASMQLIQWQDFLLRLRVKHAIECEEREQLAFAEADLVLDHETCVLFVDIERSTDESIQSALRQLVDLQLSFQQVVVVLFGNWELAKSSHQDHFLATISRLPRPCAIRFAKTLDQAADCVSCELRRVESIWSKRGEGDIWRQLRTFTQRKETNLENAMAILPGHNCFNALLALNAMSAERMPLGEIMSYDRDSLARLFPWLDEFAVDACLATFTKSMGLEVVPSTAIQDDLPAAAAAAATAVATDDIEIEGVGGFAEGLPMHGRPLTSMPHEYMPGPVPGQPHPANHPHAPAASESEPYNEASYLFPPRQMPPTHTREPPTSEPMAFSGLLGTSVDFPSPRPIPPMQHDEYSQPAEQRGNPFHATNPFDGELPPGWYEIPEEPGTYVNWPVSSALVDHWPHKQQQQRSRAASVASLGGPGASSMTIVDKQQRQAPFWEAPGRSFMSSMQPARPQLDAHMPSLYPSDSSQYYPNHNLPPQPPATDPLPHTSPAHANPHINPRFQQADVYSPPSRRVRPSYHYQPYQSYQYQQQRQQQPPHSSREYSVMHNMAADGSEDGHVCDKMQRYASTVVGGGGGRHTYDTQPPQYGSGGGDFVYGGQFAEYENPVDHWPHHHPHHQQQQQYQQQYQQRHAHEARTPFKRGRTPARNIRIMQVDGMDAYLREHKPAMSSHGRMSTSDAHPQPSPGRPADVDFSDFSYQGNSTKPASKTPATAGRPRAFVRFSKTPGKRQTKLYLQPVR
ncbi:unnamed protein product [Vitrella brassicaformis CCMP3155]|uniref:Uncharacterized protein n=4 Tax=Vitrella brassicaformis TaxID=1169539 RepID=A0A0G4GKL4_VITBC|nr:unnamed protein product [Vitrella brassicaformis CCMP3155]|eukprot:CEM30577.1 unnamed protein product [Vitrella brassicaformis CCMP3155]